MIYNKITIALIIAFCTFAANAQTILDKQEAVDIALEHNFDIRLVNNDVDAAKNSSSIYNSGYLPSLNAGGGANYDNSENKNEFQDGNYQENASISQSYNASIGVNYLIFDGLGRKYNYKKLKEMYNLSEIQARRVVELTLLQLLISYYDVARLTENKSNQEESLSISKERLLRETYNFQYGQNTQLDVLNSEVDVNNDSI